MNRCFSPTLVCLALAASAGSLAASEPRFWVVQTASDFLAGETEGLSVDSHGRLRIALASELVHDPETPSIWALASGRDDALYVGTGNDGKLLESKGDLTRLFHDADELEFHALAFGPDGRLYAATNPDGRVYAFDRSGEVETFFDPEDRYIWSLAFAPDGALYVATGSGARLYRVDAEGASQQLLESSETHLTALSATPGGDVYVGSAPSGIIYRVGSDLAVFAVHDSGYQEVKALEPVPGGGVYAAVIGDAAAPAPATPGAAVVAATATVLVTPGAQPPTGQPAGQPAQAPAPQPMQGQTIVGQRAGAVLRIAPDGSVEQLWSSTQDTPHALAPAPGGVLVGTGNRGKLYRVRDDRTWSMEETFPGEQITALHRAADGSVALATSNPGRIYRLSSAPREGGHFLSSVHDAGTLSRWGRLSWETELPAGAVVALQTRSGNTATPDATWSEWSPPHPDPAAAAVVSKSARFLQIKATLSAAAAGTPVVTGIRTAYLQRNLRPEIGEVRVFPAGQVFPRPLTGSGEVQVLGLDPSASSGPEASPSLAAQQELTMISSTTAGRPLFRRGLRTFTWTASDANGDALVYDVHYRAVEDTRFRPLTTGLELPVLTWDTSTLPDGRYLLRVSASDSAANPPQLALVGSRESLPFDVDNSAPLVSLQLGEDSGSVDAVVLDAASPIRRLEYSLNAGPWVEVYPEDGISDSPEERFSIRPRDLAPREPHVLVVRATDALGNSATAMIELAGR